VEQYICNVKNIFLHVLDFVDFVYHTFVPVCTLKDRNSEAPISLFAENVNINLYDFNSINHPNLMGARRSCGQFHTCHLLRIICLNVPTWHDQIMHQGDGTLSKY
jgi:hypothetical protein